MKKSKFCTECGNEITESQEFCNNCGNKLDNSKNNKKIKENPKNKNKNFAVVGIIVIIFLFIISAVVVSSNNNSNSTNYQEALSGLKTNYSDLESKFNSTKKEIFSGSNKVKEQKYIDAELELIRANSAISDVESALKAGKSSNEVDERIQTAKEKLTLAEETYNNL